VWWAACAEQELPEAPEPLELLALELTQAEQAPVWTVRVSVSQPAGLELAVEGGGERRVSTKGPQTEHLVQLIGLVPGAEHQLDITLTRGEERMWLDPLPFTTAPVPEQARLPLQILAHDPDRADPGWLLLSPQVLDPPEGSLPPPLLLLDSQLEPRWWLWAGPSVSDLRVGPDGQLWSLSGSGVQHLGWDGTVLQRWHPQPQEGELWLPTLRAHHEVWPEPDGSFWTLGIEVVESDSYPVSYVEPEPVPGEYLVEDNPLMHMGADGTVLSHWLLHERLDPAKIGFDSLSSDAVEGLDWTHANGLSIDAQGGVVLSLRNLDAVVRLDSSGELDWILGDPRGWSSPFADRLLTPVLSPGQGPWRWFYHQHAPEWHEDEQLLVLFDNHIYGHTPYGPSPPEPLYSRVVAYEIDLEARTVRQRWVFDQTSTGPLLSEVMGNASLLPSGNVLADYAQVEVEGQHAVRIVEFDPERPDEPALDLQLLPDPTRAPTGWLLYRARKIPAF
jgi:hypothetical protein